MQKTHSQCSEHYSPFCQAACLVHITDSKLGPEFLKAEDAGTHIIAKLPLWVQNIIC